MHGHENFGVLTALIALARSTVGHQRLVLLGTDSDQLGDPHVLGVPVLARRITARALRTARFTPVSSYRFFKHDLKGSVPPPTFPLAEISPLGDPAWKRIQLVDGRGNVWAWALMYSAGPDHLVLRYLDFNKSRRGRRMGVHLLNQCLHYAIKRGADSLVSYAETDDHERAALLFCNGFIQHDTIVSYESPH
ncbi:GNAT family N-acetyltransferase [Streptomyces violascens]